MTDWLSQNTSTGPLIGTPNIRILYLNPSIILVAIHNSMNSEPKLNDSTVFWVSEFRRNMHVLWILSARILPRLATSPVLDIVHYLQHRTIQCSTVLPTVSTRSPRRVFISVDALLSRGYWYLLMVHLTLRTHSHTLASYPHLGTCWLILYMLPVSRDFLVCLLSYLNLRNFSIRKHVQQTFSSWTW